MWWRGDSADRQFQSDIADHLNINPELKEHGIPPLNPPFKIIREFWIKRWMILFPVIAASIVALFIHFNGKAERKAKQENQGNVSGVHKTSQSDK